MIIIKSDNIKNIACYMLNIEFNKNIFDKDCNLSKNINLDEGNNLSFELENINININTNIGNIYLPHNIEINNLIKLLQKEIYLLINKNIELFKTLNLIIDNDNFIFNIDLELNNKNDLIIYNTEILNNIKSTILYNRIFINNTDKNLNDNIINNINSKFIWKFSFINTSNHINIINYDSHNFIYNFSSIFIDINNIFNVKSGFNLINNNFKNLYLYGNIFYLNINKYLKFNINSDLNLIENPKIYKINKFFGFIDSPFFNKFNKKIIKCINNISNYENKILFLNKDTNDHKDYNLIDNQNFNNCNCNKCNIISNNKCYICSNFLIKNKCFNIHILNNLDNILQFNSCYICTLFITYINKYASQSRYPYLYNTIFMDFHYYYNNENYENDEIYHYIKILEILIENKFTFKITYITNFIESKNIFNNINLKDNIIEQKLIKYNHNKLYNNNLNIINFNSNTSLNLENIEENYIGINYNNILNNINFNNINMFNKFYLFEINNNI